MEQFLIFQVRVNIIQQNLVTLDKDDSTNFQRIANDILKLYDDVVHANSTFLIDEYLPQIENLCTILTSKTSLSL